MFRPFQMCFERPLPEPPGPAPAVVTESARGKKIECGYCGCCLAPSGDVLSMSEQAKKFRDMKDAHERELQRAAVALQESQDALKAANDELVLLRAPKARKGFLDDV